MLGSATESSGRFVSRVGGVNDGAANGEVSPLEINPLLPSLEAGALPSLEGAVLEAAAAESVDSPAGTRDGAACCGGVLRGAAGGSCTLR